MAKLAAKQEEHGDNNKNVIITAGILVLLMFNVLNGYALYTAFHKIENLSSVPLDIHQIVLGIVGVLMIVVGNIMSKLRMNSIAGLRTHWSMKNEVTWKNASVLEEFLLLLGG